MVQRGLNMELKPDEAQKIVNRVINILGKNINIMDKNGIIIASGYMHVGLHRHNVVRFKRIIAQE